MQNNFPKIPLFLSIVFFLVSCSLFYFLYTQIEESTTKAEQNFTLWQTEVSKRNDLRELDNSMKTIEGQRVELETHFAKSSNVVPFLDNVESVAGNAGAKAEITSVNVLPDKSGLSVGVKASGTFGALYKFIRLLENSPYQIEILSMDLHKVTASAGKDAGWDVSLKIILLSFVQ